MNNTDIITKLRIAITDARQNESHFESWMILNEAICDAIDALAEQPAQQEPDWLDKEQTETDWDHVWLLIKAASYASSKGFISGTTNWGSAVSRYMRNESPQLAQQEQGDSICQEDDGCPTEKAVLQRFWRGQSIPEEHYPAWFKPVQQEPVAKKKHEPKIDLGKYAGTYGGYITPEPSEGYLQKAYRLANELRSHLSIAPAQRTWVNATTWRGLTDEEIDRALDAAKVPELPGGYESVELEIARAIEAKLKEKNT